ncbi:uncharacterized protein TNCV_222711 [Trichonephila clavipes]|nr:uncharacterized protein TNCV_222711 [Trichonephila clavipes]
MPAVLGAAVAEWSRYRIVACLVTSSSPVSLKTRRVGERCTLNMPRAQTSSCWCDVVVRRGDASSAGDWLLRYDPTPRASTGLGSRVDAMSRFDVGND